jgi:hypothetical protein
MAISPVHTSTDSVTQAIAQSKKSATTQQPQGTATLNNNDHTGQTRQVQQANQTATVQAPKPVVNSQGQTTGKIVNATA